MGTSSYLQPDEYAAYGLSASTPEALVQQASLLINGELRRPEGLIWNPDAGGLPCYMAASTPTMTAAAGASFAPGASVVVPITGVPLTQDLVGEVFIVDRANPSLVEACSVIAVNSTAGTVTLAKVSYAHSSGATMETGLVILEERSVPAQRSVTRIAKGPVVRLVSGMGRYGYGRRSQQVAGAFNDYNLLPTIGTFGGPPAWIPFDVTQASISTATDEIWLPVGLLLAYYSECRLRYVAGWPQAALPSEVKQATANIIAAFNALPVTGNVKKYQAGDTSIERFKDSIFDTNTKALLSRFYARMFI